MFCPKCGTNNRDGSTFCVGCGSPLLSASPAPAPWSAPAAPEDPRPKLGQAVSTTLKSLATSPLMIIAAIAYCLVMALSLFSTAEIVDMSELYALMREMGMSYSEISEISEMMSGMQSGISVGTVISMIPSILVAVGMWITIASGANKQSNRMTTSGLTMIQVIQIINTVLGSLAVLLLLVAVLALSGAVSELSEDVSIIFLVCAVVIALVAAFMIFYNVMIISTIGKIKKSIRTGNPHSKVSMFVAVMCIISGGFTALGIFSSMTSITSFLSSALTAVYPILFGVLLITYRNRMRALEYQFNSLNRPVYPAYPATPAAPTYNAYTPYSPAPQYSQPVKPVYSPVPESSKSQDPE